VSTLCPLAVMPSTRHPGFPQAIVTSSLVREIQRADHCQGGGGRRTGFEKRHKWLVIKILTYNPLRLKILQTSFANPAPVKAFRGGGGGGPPRFHRSPKTKLTDNHVARALNKEFFRGRGKFSRTGNDGKTKRQRKEIPDEALEETGRARPQRLRKSYQRVHDRGRVALSGVQGHVKHMERVWA